MLDFLLSRSKSCGVTAASVWNLLLSKSTGRYVGLVDEQANTSSGRPNIHEWPHPPSSSTVIQRPASSSSRSLPPAPMPLLRGAPPCVPLPRATSDRFCGGSSQARCCLPLRQACFLPPADLKNGCALSYPVKNTRWKPVFALETGAGSANSDGREFEENTGFLGRTRLGRLIQAAARELLEKLKSGRTNSPTKVFLLLLGFYTANALATILGQTGDWDVLVAAVIVTAIEGIGMLKYRKPAASPPGRFQSLIGKINYWKAGVCLGFFVDAFKVGS